MIVNVTIRPQVGRMILREARDGSASGQSTTSRITFKLASCELRCRGNELLRWHSLSFSLGTLTRYSRLTRKSQALKSKKEAEAVIYVRGNCDFKFRKFR